MRTSAEMDRIRKLAPPLYLELRALGLDVFLDEDAEYFASLTVAAVAALMSGLFMVKSVREREPSFAWAFAMVFVVSAFLVGLYIWRLL